MQGRSVTPEIAGICNKCSLYLNTCMPVIDHGFLYGECDNDYCSECYLSEDCGTWKGGETNYDQELGYYHKRA